MTLISDCPVCGRRELRGVRSLHVQPTVAGSVLALTCTQCGSVLRAADSRPLRRGAVPPVATASTNAA